MRIILAIILLITSALAAYSFPYDSAYSEKAVNSIEDISASIISDSFSPMTHYSAGDKVFSAVPAYFTIDGIMEDPDVDGKDLKGGAFGAGGGYALTDEFMAYLIIAGLKISGDLQYPAYGEQFGVVKSSGDYSLFNALAGIGYDLLSDDVFSIPVYFGANLQYYSAELKSDPVSWFDNLVTFQNYDVTAETSGDGFLYGVSGGIAVSAKIYSKVKITPYLLYIHNFNCADMNAEASLANANPLLSGKEKFKLDVEPVSAFMTGLNIGYIGDSGFSASVALGSMLSSLTGYGSRASANGVEMKSFVLILSYNM